MREGLVISVVKQWERIVITREVVWRKMELNEHKFLGPSVGH